MRQEYRLPCGAVLTLTQEPYSLARFTLDRLLVTPEQAGQIMREGRPGGRAWGELRHHLARDILELNGVELTPGEALQTMEGADPLQVLGVLGAQDRKIRLVVVPARW